MHECKQEERLRLIEHSEAVMGTEVKNLISTIDNLMGWIRALVIATIPLIGAAFGFLIMRWVGK
jgi:hypothetical protein